MTTVVAYGDRPVLKRKGKERRKKERKGKRKRKGKGRSKLNRKGKTKKKGDGEQKKLVLGCPGAPEAAPSCPRVHQRDPGPNDRDITSKMKNKEKETK